MSNPVTFKKGIGQDQTTGVWWMRTRVNGREYRKSFRTRKDAELALDALKRHRAAGQLGLVSVEAQETLGTIIDRYIKDGEARGLSAWTIQDYKAIGKRLKAFFGARHHPRITQDEIAGYVRHRRATGVTTRTVHKELVVLSSFIRGTVGVSYLTWSIPKLVAPDQNAPTSIPTDKELVTVYHTLAPRPDIQRAFLLGLLTGLRTGDVHRLNSQDITKGVIISGMRKRRGQPITIPLVKTLQAALEGVEGSLTCSTNGTKMYLQRHTDWNGLGHLRAVCATWASQAGFGDEDVSILLGHSRWSVARKHYIRAQTVDPFVALRKKMLVKVEARFLKSCAHFAPT